MEVYLVVDDTLSKVHDLGELGRYYFTSQKELNNIIMANRKYSRNDIGGRYPLDEFIQKYRLYSEGKMVIKFSDDSFADKILMASPKELQNTFEKIKGKINIHALLINSFRHYVDIALRRVVIKEYYLKEIVPKISKAALDANDKATFSDFHIKYTGWGYIAAFRPRILLEFFDGPCYWIKLLHSAESLDIVQQNLTKSKQTKIFIGNPGDSVRYIDIFTSDENTAHLMQLISPEDIKAINVSLKPIIQQLKTEELFYAISGWNEDLNVTN